MGGMISIELACAAPERVESLSLLVSTRGRYIPDMRSMIPLLGAIFSPTQTGVVKNTVSLNYPPDFLDRPVGDHQDVRSVLERHYSTLPNRHKPAGYKALLCQGLAVQTHYVSDERLEIIAQAGFPVLVVGSMQDILILRRSPSSCCSSCRATRCAPSSSRTAATALTRSSPRRSPTDSWRP